MSNHDDLGIFRRFGTLNAQNLLYLQAEMHALEWKIQTQFDEDLISTEKERKYYAFDWVTMDRVYEESTDKTSDENAQMRLVLKLREKIKEYSSFQLPPTRAYMMRDIGLIYNLQMKPSYYMPKSASSKSPPRVDGPS